ncbi:MAG: hypothetical protein WCL06_04605 [Bacteroidota bacterium]
MASLSKFEQFRRTFVIIGGVIYLVMGVFHLYFWILFDWQTELFKLNQINSNNMQMLNIVVCFFMFSFSYMMLWYNSRVLNSKLGRSILIISSGFFLIRALIEFAFPGNSIVYGVVLLAFIPVYLIPALTMATK